MSESNLDTVLESLRVCFIKDDRMRGGFDGFVAMYRPVLEWLMEHNSKPHMDVSKYHNTRHLIGVGFLTWWLTGNEPAIVLAALIHDFHYANESPDGVNIHHSLFQAEELGYFKLPQVAPIDSSYIAAAVRATEYDFAHPFPEISTPDYQSIRDADQLYATVFFDEVLYQGLEAEVGPKVKSSGVDFLSRNALYVANNRFYTNAAASIRDQYLSECLIRHVQCSHLYAVSSDNESDNYDD